MFCSVWQTLLLLLFKCIRHELLFDNIMQYSEMFILSYLSFASGPTIVRGMKFILILILVASWQL